MAKKAKKKRPVYKFEMLADSRAIVRNVPEESDQEPQRISAAKFLDARKEQISTVPADVHPHRNRTLALTHSLCDEVSQRVSAELDSLGKPAACESGCDACCYYSDMDATSLEFEEIVHYIINKQPSVVGRRLLEQAREEPDFERHGHRPCPFLDRTVGACGIYSVRPTGCRGLLATKRCELDVEEDTGLAETVDLVGKAWQKMPMMPGPLIAAEEALKRKHNLFDTNNMEPDYLVPFKEIEAEKLVELFSASEAE